MLTTAHLTCLAIIHDVAGQRLGLLEARHGRMTDDIYLVKQLVSQLQARCLPGWPCDARLRSTLARSAYTIGAAKFIDWAKTQPLMTVTRATIQDWIATLRTAGHKPGSINTWLSGLRAFYAWALAERRLTSDPTADLKGAKRKGTTRQHKRAALTDREVVRVLRQPDTSTLIGIRDRAILALMAYTAARTIEVHRADLADLKSAAGQMVLHVQGKGRDEKDELIVIDNPSAAGALHDWLSVRGDQPGPLFVSLSDRSHGARLSLRALRHMVKGYYLAAGVLGKDKTAHSLRHAACIDRDDDDLLPRD